MASELHISLPESLLAWVHQQATAQGLSSPAEYVQQVLSEERSRSLRLRVEQEIRAGLDSGPAEPMTAADWERIRNEVDRRLNQIPASP